jgi:hypothetical protein
MFHEIILRRIRKPAPPGSPSSLLSNHRPQEWPLQQTQTGPPVGAESKRETLEQALLGVNVLLKVTLSEAQA